MTSRHARRKGKLLITAGPTHEAIDPVRYLANRSSGRLGIALAHAARAAGWSVTLLLGPDVTVRLPGVRVVQFESTADLAASLKEHFPDCDVLIMAAAVADYRPRCRQGDKIPRVGKRLILELERTPDLVAECAAHKRTGQRVIGFALESPDQLEPRGREKLRKKGLDAIVANPLETMGAGEIRAVVYTASGETIRPARRAGSMSKVAFARWLISWLDSESAGLR